MKFKLTLKQSVKTVGEGVITCYPENLHLTQTKATPEDRDQIMMKAILDIERAINILTNLRAHIEEIPDSEVLEKPSSYDH